MQVVAATSLQSQSQPPEALRKAFDQFVGETFYGQMMAALRKTTGKAPYFHGGRAEEIFQGQFDQTIAQKLSESNAHSFTGSMFKQFLSQTNPEAALGEASSLSNAPAAAASEDSSLPPWAGLLSANRR